MGLFISWEPTCAGTRTHWLTALSSTGGCIRELNERRSSAEDYVYPKNAHRPVAHLTVGGGGGGTFKSQPWAEAILREYVLLCVSTVPVTYEGDNAEIPC